MDHPSPSPSEHRTVETSESGGKTPSRNRDLLISEIASLRNLLARNPSDPNQTQMNPYMREIVLSDLVILEDQLKELDS